MDPYMCRESRVHDQSLQECVLPVALAWPVTDYDNAVLLLQLPLSAAGSGLSWSFSGCRGCSLKISDI